MHPAHHRSRAHTRRKCPDSIGLKSPSMQFPAATLALHGRAPPPLRLEMPAGRKSCSGPEILAGQKTAELSAAEETVARSSGTGCARSPSPEPAGPANVQAEKLH